MAKRTSEPGARPRVYFRLKTFGRETSARAIGLGNRRKTRCAALSRSTIQRLVNSHRGAIAALRAALPEGADTDEVMYLLWRLQVIEYESTRRLAEFCGIDLEPLVDDRPWEGTL